jgi:hypothetical protein
MMDLALESNVSGHLRTGRYSQRERPAATLPSRLLGSRYGAESRFRVCWEPILATAAAATLARLVQDD